MQSAKERGSSDNISVIVVFLREPSKIAAEAHWANRNGTTAMDAGLDNANAANNPFANSNGTNDILSQKDGFLLNLNDGFKQNGAEKSQQEEYFDISKVKRSEFDDEDEDDDDLGPETSVDDVVDGEILSPALASPKALLAEAVVSKDLNVDDAYNPFADHVNEKTELEAELCQQIQQNAEFDAEKLQREETPTPPADAGEFI